MRKGESQFVPNPPSGIPTRTDSRGAMPHEQHDRIQSASRHFRHRLAHLARQDAGKCLMRADRRGNHERTRRIPPGPLLGKPPPGIVSVARHDRHHQGAPSPQAPGCSLEARCALPKRTPEVNSGPPRPQGVRQLEEPPVGLRAIARSVRRKNHSHLIKDYPAAVRAPLTSSSRLHSPSPTTFMWSVSGPRA